MALPTHSPASFIKKHQSAVLLFGPSTVLVGLGGFEPPTPRLSSVCSNQLSYRPFLSLGSAPNPGSVAHGSHSPRAAP